MDNPVLNRRESLILTAIDVINELGIQGLSIREVVKRQGISNAALFNHFNSKNDLILAVLDHHIQYDGAIIQSIKFRELKSKEAITYFVESFAAYYQNYPAITAIEQNYDVLRCELGLSEKVKRIFSNRGIYIKQMAEEAQAAGQIHTDIDSECISDIILGSFRTICLKWRMDGYSFSLKDRTLYTLNAILDSFTPKSRG